MKKTYNIEIDCPNCALKMEDAAKKTKGVNNANVNFMTQKMTIEVDDNTNISTIIKNVYKNCKKIDSDCIIYI